MQLLFGAASSDNERFSGLRYLSFLNPIQLSVRDGLSAQGPARRLWDSDIILIRVVLVGAAGAVGLARCCCHRTRWGCSSWQPISAGSG